MRIDLFSDDELTLRMAIDKANMALRALTQQHPPGLELAAHGLMLALEHVQALAASAAIAARDAAARDAAAIARPTASDAVMGKPLASDAATSPPHRPQTP